MLFPPQIVRKYQQALAVRRIDRRNPESEGKLCSTLNCKMCLVIYYNNTPPTQVTCLERVAENKPFCKHCLSKLPYIHRLEATLSQRAWEREMAFSRNPLDWQKINPRQSTYCSDILTILRRYYMSPERLAQEAGISGRFIYPFLQILRDRGYIKIFQRKESAMAALGACASSKNRIVSITEKGKILAAELWAAR